ncbi:MAG TPA: chemotaxis protein CheD [Cyclobacteriaceae bacterium]|jgi:chemotaxis protein CheD|nr:chemotaxis protein CheD [Cyclobacteriaceae bacterium]
MINLKKLIVFPGQMVITTVPSLISTVLGSCVSVCLWDRVTKTGAMNHYLLPGTEKDEAGNTNRGLTSVPLLISAMLNRNVRRENIEAKVFGGCNSLYIQSDTYKVGERNISIAMELLRDLGIKLTAHHVGGSYGRKIVFNTDTGKVRMRLLINKIEINEEINKGFGY